MVEKGEIDYSDQCEICWAWGPDANVKQMPSTLWMCEKCAAQTEANRKAKDAEDERVRRLA